MIKKLQCRRLRPDFLRSCRLISFCITLYLLCDILRFNCRRLDFLISRKLLRKLIETWLSGCCCNSCCCTFLDTLLRQAPRIGCCAGIESSVTELRARSFRNLSPPPRRSSITSECTFVSVDRVHGSIFYYPTKGTSDPNAAAANYTCS